jgi:hypothetical protein
VFDEVYILFHFNIILKHNGKSSTKIVGKVNMELQLDATITVLLISKISSMINDAWSNTNQDCGC